MSLSFTIRYSWRASRTICARLLTLVFAPRFSRQTIKRIARCGNSAFSCSTSLNRGIVCIADPEDNLVFRIILQTMTAEAFIHLGIGATERLERLETGRVGRTLLSVAFRSRRNRSRAPQAQYVVSDAGDRASHSQNFNDLEGLVNHEWFEPACLENRQGSGFGLPPFG